MYRRFVDTGNAPSLAFLADVVGGRADEIRGALRRLASTRHLVLDAEDRIVMAHPFTAVPLGFSVMGTRSLWWGGCAWDSFAIPHLVGHEPEVLVTTRCPGCQSPHAIVVDKQAPPSGSQLAHFLVPAARMWEDVVYTCGHQRIFCDHSCVDKWLATTSNQLGYVMDLPTLWRLASGWYQGRLDRGYVRREPAEASSYLRDAGLSGEFWGL